MNESDVALFRYAEQLANNGQTTQAHEMFCALAERNAEVEVLFWVATTSADTAEARNTIDAIKRKAPHHPRLKELERFHDRKLQATYAPMAPMAPVLLCPHCGVRAPAIAKSKISVGGWVCFAAFFALFLYCEFTWFPIAQAATMGNAGVVFLVIGIIGLFAIRKRVYACGHCGSKIAATV